MKSKGLAVTGIAIALSLSSLNVSYAEVKINGETVTETVHEGDITNTSENTAVSVSEGDDISVKGDIEQKTGGSGAAVTVEGKDSSVEIEGNVTSDAGGFSISEGTVSVEGDVKTESSAIVNDEGSVTIKGNLENDRNNSDTVINVKGSVTIDGNVSSTGERSTTVLNHNGSVQVEGDVTKKDDGRKGTPAVENEYGETKVKGDISSSGRGVDNYSGSVEVEGNITSDEVSVYNRKGSVSVKGDIVSTAERYRDAVINREGNITIDGNVTATEGKGITNTSGGTATVNGNVRAAQTAVSNTDGTITITGNVSSTGGAISNGEGTVTVNGDVNIEQASPEDSKFLSGAGISNRGGKVVVNGNVNSDSQKLTAVEQTLSGNAVINGNIKSNARTAVSNRLGSNMTVNGDVTAAEDGLTTDFSASTKINGDIIAEKAGLEIEVIDHGLHVLHYKDEYKDYKDKGTIIVDGTIKSKTTRPIIAWTSYDRPDEETIGNLPDIIVYQVESEAGKPLVQVPTHGNFYNSKRQKAAEEFVASKINYIIRRSDSENASFNLENTRMMEGYETARAKETIRINVTTSDGYAVSHIEGGQAIAKKRSDGVWELTVPDGGGVTISVLVKAIEEAEKEGATEKVIGGSAKAETSSDYVNDKVDVSSQDAIAGAWNADGTFNIGEVKARGQWVKIYVKEADTAAWFYFDENGNRLIGWQRIQGSDGKYRWYYLNPKQGVLQGACYINSRTPDGYRVNMDGAWIKDGVIQEAID